MSDLAPVPRLPQTDSAGGSDVQLNTQNKVSTGGQILCPSKRRRLNDSSATVRPFSTIILIDVLSVSVRSIFPSDIAGRWETLAQYSYVDGGRLDDDDRGFVSAVSGSSNMRDDEGIRLTVQYNSNGESLPIMSVFAYYVQYPDRLDAQQLRVGFRFNGHNFKILVGRNLRISCASGWLQQWMHSGGRGGIVCRCSSFQTDSPLIRMYEEVDYEGRLSTMTRRFCIQLDERSLLCSDIAPHFDLACIDFPFSTAWICQQAEFRAHDVDFETSCRQGLFNTAAHMLVGCQNVEVFAAVPRDRRCLYVGVDDFGWGEYIAHRLLGALTPPVFSYYSNLSLSSVDGYRHLGRSVALTELAVGAVMRSLHVAHYGVASLFGIVSSIKLGGPILLSVSRAVQDLVEDVVLLDIVRGSDFGAVFAVMAWDTISAIRWDLMTVGDAAPFIRFDAVRYTASCDQGAVLYTVVGAPLLDQVHISVSEYFDSTKFNEGENVIAPEVPYNAVDVPLGLSQAHVSVRMSDTVSFSLVVPTSSRVDLSVSSPMPTSARRSAATLTIFASYAMAVVGSDKRPDEIIEASSLVPRLMHRRGDDGDDYNDALRILREQREAATRLAALRLADLENARQDVAMAQLTITRRTSALEHVRDDNAHLVDVNCRLVSEADAIQQRLADSEAEVSRLRSFLRGVRDPVDEFYLLSTS